MTVLSFHMNQPDRALSLHINKCDESRLTPRRSQMIQTLADTWEENDRKCSCHQLIKCQTFWSFACLLSTASIQGEVAMVTCPRQDWLAMFSAHNSLMTTRGVRGENERVCDGKHDDEASRGTGWWCKGLGGLVVRRGILVFTAHRWWMLSVVEQVCGIVYYGDRLMFPW